MLNHGWCKVSRCTLSGDAKKLGLNVPYPFYTEGTNTCRQEWSQFASFHWHVPNIAWAGYDFTQCETDHDTAAASLLFWLAGRRP